MRGSVWVGECVRERVREGGERENANRVGRGYYVLS